MIACIFYQKSFFKTQDEQKIFLLIGPLMNNITEQLTAPKNNFLIEEYKRFWLGNSNDSLKTNKFEKKTKLELIKMILILVVGQFQDAGFKLVSPTTKINGAVHRFELVDVKYEDLFANSFKLSRKPMVIPPKKWFLDKDENLVGGGYLKSQLHNIPVFASDKINFKYSPKYSPVFRDKLNLVQEIPYLISPQDFFLKSKKYFFSLTKILEDAVYKHQKELACENEFAWAFYDEVKKASQKVANFVQDIFTIITLMKCKGVTHPDSLLRFYLPLFCCKLGRMFQYGRLNIVNSKFLRTLLRGENGTELVFYDATSSMIQIYSILFGDIQIAKFSNLGSEGPYDPVMKISEMLFTKPIDVDTDFLYLTKDRNFLKKSIMLLLYGSGTQSLTRKVIEDLIPKNVRLAYGNDFQSLRKKVYSAVLWAEKNVRQVFKLIFDIKLLCESKKEKKNLEEITFFWQENSARYSYFKKKKVFVSLTKILNKDVKRSRIGIDISDDKAKDVSKNIRTIFSTLLQSLDADVALNTRYFLKKEFNVNCFSIHDCFCTQESDVNLLKKVYKEKVFEAAFDKNITDILNIRDINFNDIQLKIDLNKNNPEWDVIRKSFSEGCLKQERSIDILSVELD